MIAICAIILTINSNSSTIRLRQNVKGTVKAIGYTKILADFSKDVLNYNIANNSKNYQNIIVDKDLCRFKK